MLRTILNTPVAINSYRVQRRWEKKILQRGTLPFNVRMANWVSDWPFGKIFFGIIAFAFFGVDMTAGLITGFDVAQQQLASSQKEHQEVSRKKLETANKTLAAKMEVLDVHRKAKETGWHTSAVNSE